MHLRRIALCISFAALGVIMDCGVTATPSQSSQALSPPPLPAPPAPILVGGPKQSIRNWAKCDGLTDDHAALVQALAAAKNNAFILEIDCPLFLHVGDDPTKPIFIDNGTQIDFSPAGTMILDNSMIPSFVLADTQDVRLTNWNIEYIGALHINKLEPDGSSASGSFNDGPLTQWLVKNRGLTFVHSARAAWAGWTDSCAIFLLTGSTSSITVENMKVYVPKNATPDHFIPMVFALTELQTPNQTVTSNTPLMQPYYAVPNNLTFSGLTFDGTYFGFQGSAQNMLVSNLVSLRYSDLQDANGQNVGGIDNWLSPPHLFYLNFNPSGDASLFNQNIAIQHVIDYGMRLGPPREITSGNCYSLKLGTVRGSVSDYMSFRPDGFMDALLMSDVTLSEITASYDSSFLHGAYPLIRFPQAPYNNLSFSNMKLADTAATTDNSPILGNGNPANTNVVINTTSVSLKQWTGSAPPLQPSFGGSGDSVDIKFIYQ